MGSTASFYNSAQDGDVVTGIPVMVDKNEYVSAPRKSEPTDLESTFTSDIRSQWINALKLDKVVVVEGDHSDRSLIRHLVVQHTLSQELPGQWRDEPVMLFQTLDNSHANVSFFSASSRADLLFRFRTWFNSLGQKCSQHLPLVPWDRYKPALWKDIANRVKALDADHANFVQEVVQCRVLIFYTVVNYAVGFYV